MAIRAIKIAEVILSMSNPEVGDIISNLKLQKLLYYTQGFYLAIKEKPLFQDPIYAWQYGPVVKSVYGEYKKYGSAAIILSDDIELLTLDKETMNLIKEVYDVYGQFSALKLMNMTHKESPWLNTIAGEKISLDSMKDYFSTLVK